MIVNEEEMIVSEEEMIVSEEEMIVSEEEMIVSEDKWPKVAIIVLNWNGWRDTIECLESIYQITYPNYEVIVVDNGSEEESIEKIKKYCYGKINVESSFFDYSSENKPIQVIEYKRVETEAEESKEKEIADMPSNRKLILIKNEKNYGFAEGNNIAIKYILKYSSIDYFLLLNNDTVVCKDFLNKLTEVAEIDKSFGIIGPKLLYYEHPSRINQIGGYINYFIGSPIAFTSIPSDMINKNYIQVDFLSGTALLVKRDVFKDIGLFDAIYFVTHEETDFEMRAKLSDWKLICALNSKVYHKISASLKKNPNVTIYYTIRNRMIFMKRYATNKQIAAFLIGFYVIDLPLTIVRLFISLFKEGRITCFTRIVSCVIIGICDGIREFAKESRKFKQK